MDFKLDISSFLLGYANGKKNDKKPVLTELTVTENGVYDQPVIVDAPDFSVGKTVTFKKAITMDDIPENIRPTITGQYIHQTFATTSDGRTWMWMVLPVANLGYGIAAMGAFMGDQTKEGFIYMDELVASTQGAQQGITEPGWYQGAENTVEPMDEPPSIIIENETMSESLASLSFLFADSSTPVDGWNKVTVNVAGDIVDVTELPTENIDEGKIYRVTNGDTVTYGIPNNATVKRLVDGAWVELT